MSKKILRVILGCCVVLSMSGMGCANSPIQEDTNKANENESSVTEEIEPTWKYLAKVENKKGKYGYINEAGEEVIPCKYESVSDDIEFGFIVVENKDGELLVLDDNGKELVPEQCENGLVVIEYELGKRGFICEEGKIVSECQFVNGLAVVCNEEGEYGYINEKGEEVIPYQFQEANDFELEGLAIVAVKKESGENKYVIIDAKGNIISSEYDRIVRNGQPNESILFSVAKRNGTDEEGNPIWKWGYVNQEGKEVIECVYDSFYEIEEFRFISDSSLDENAGKNGFTNGICVVQKNNNGVREYGVINEQGELLIPFGKYYYIHDEIDNNVLIVCEYVSEEYHAKRYVFVKWGCIDVFENEIVPIEYDYLYKNWCGTELFYCKKEGEWYGNHYNQYGREIFSEEEKDAYLQFEANGLAQVWNSDGKWGFMNTLGDMEIPFGTFEIEGWVYQCRADSFIIEVGVNNDSSENFEIMNYDGEIIGCINNVEHGLTYVTDKIIAEGSYTEGALFSLFDINGQKIGEQITEEIGTEFMVVECENGFLRGYDIDKRVSYYYYIPDEDRIINFSDKYKDCGDFVEVGKCRITKISNN